MAMKSFLQLILGIVGLAITTHALLAADAPIGYTSNATSARAPLNYSATNSVATSSSNAVISALNSQAMLLKEIIQDHQQKAADLAQKGQSEKAKWETDLVSELKDKGARVQKNIDQVNQSWPGTSNLKGGAGEVDDQLVFLSTVDARLDQIHQELLTAIDDSRILATQISTNKAPDEFAGMSFVLSENQKLVKDLQREQLNLELRKLEFRTILKVMQKL